MHVYCSLGRLLRLGEFLTWMAGAVCAASGPDCSAIPFVEALHVRDHRRAVIGGMLPVKDRASIKPAASGRPFSDQFDAGV
jgi:hypothetical protein